MLIPAAIPFAVSGVRPIPFAKRSTVKDMLDDMKAKGIIRPITVATDWTHPLVVVNKPNGKLRICVDLTRLNAHVKRPLHPLISPRDAVASISNHAKFYNTFEAKNGYWQIPLAEDSQLLKTFITSWGRFKFLRGPMGLVSTGDEYCRRVGAALGHLPRLIRVVDDILSEEESVTMAYDDARSIFSTCRENHITLGKSKFDLAVQRVQFTGFIVESGGLSTDRVK